MYTVHLRTLRIAPRKVRLVAALIRGMRADEALVSLNMQVTKASVPMKKLLESALANVKDQKGDVAGLRITSVTVGDGPRIKRFQPRAFGRAFLIMHKTCHVTLTLA
jgi:large subunit ribosomal protein L22